jgi:predicted DNA binding protein
VARRSAVTRASLDGRGNDDTDRGELVTVLVDISIPTNAFELGEILDPPPGLEVELVEFVPVSDGTIPYLWIESDTKRFKQFERRIRADERVNAFWSEDARNGRRLVRLDWDRQPDGLLEAFLDENVIIQHGVGTHDGWRFQLHFRNRSAAAAFQQHCVDTDVPFTILRISEPESADELTRYGLTEAQLEALILAREEGYFEDPRATTLEQLGEQLGITRQAVSYRIRAGMKHLIDATLRSEHVDTYPATDRGAR